MALPDLQIVQVYCSLRMESRRVRSKFILQFHAKKLPKSDTKWRPNLMCSPSSHFGCINFWALIAQAGPHANRGRRLLNSTALHSIAMYCISLHCTALNCTVLHCMKLNWTVLHTTVLHLTLLPYTALKCTVLHCTV